MIVDRFVEERLSHEELFSELRGISIADVKTLIYTVEDVLASESMLVRLPAGEVEVVGDMHGDIAVTLAIARQILDGGPEKRVVFLGDYVDKGMHQVDVINLVLLLKATNPARVTMLRGNHEIAAQNELNGFRHNLKLQFGQDDGHILWHLYNRLFTRLPLAAVTWNGVFLVHGGIPEGMQDIGQIEGLPREYNPENQLSFELLWNDPVEAKRPFLFRKGSRGGGAKEFGELAFNDFVARTRVTRVVRSHEEYNDGFRYFFGDRLLSIFSSRRVIENPFERQIKPKVVRINKDGAVTIEAVDPAVLMT